MVETKACRTCRFYYKDPYTFPELRKLPNVGMCVCSGFTQRSDNVSFFVSYTLKEGGSAVMVADKFVCKFYQHDETYFG